MLGAVICFYDRRNMNKTFRGILLQKTKSFSVRICSPYDRTVSFFATTIFRELETCRTFFRFYT